MAIEGVPVSLAFASGAMATLNPCGFPLLPAFLSFYVGAEQGPPVVTAGRVGQGLRVGLLATVGFLGLFAAIGLPIAFGATAVSRTIPWTGICLGLVLVGIGLLTLAGVHVRLPAPRQISVRHDRQSLTIMAFGAGYGLASLGCTLPIFLTLVGASLGAGPNAGSLLAFAAYGAGMALMLMALSVAAALARGGLVRRLRRLLPFLPRLSGGFLLLAGGYLSYYWWRIRFGPRATLSSDFIVGPVMRFSAGLTARATGGGSTVLMLAGLVVVISCGALVWPRRREPNQGG
jgi:cytochrome c-type biogenesis protein